MKLFHVGCVLLLASLMAAPAARAQEAPAPAAAEVKSSADRDWAAFQDLQRTRPPALPREMGPEKYLTWLDGLLQKLDTAGFAFIDAYPTDPRRWDVAVVLITSQPPLFATGFKPAADGKGFPTPISDEAAKAAWSAKVEGLERALLASSDASPAQREAVDWSNFAKEFRAATVAMRAGKPVDWPAFRARYDAHLAKYAQLPVMAARARDYLGALDRDVPGSAIVEWKHLLNAPNEAVRAEAASQILVAEAKTKPMNLAFTAVDGRPVDLAKLRGKVVLIDFWATWCGPCKAEMPNVIAAYNQYHDKGFEIVGISLDQADGKQKLIDYTQAHGMPWPQFFDGKFWQNEIAVKYGIQAIPASFLLDQKGVVVASNLRGADLDAAVKKQLGL